MYEGGKVLNGIRSMYVNSVACVRVKEGESEGFRIDSGVRQGCIMCPWFFNMYMGTVMKEVKMGMERRRESGDYLPSFMQVLYGESKEDLKAIVERFVEVCRTRGLKVNAGKTKGMMLNGD